MTLSQFLDFCDKNMNADKWKTLPMELMKQFNDCHEWALMEAIWFKSNLEGYTLNLSDLNNDTPIKSRPTLLRVLDRLVSYGWINKTPLGNSNKHHKYSLNRAGFVDWMKKVSNETSSAQRFQMKPEEVLNETGKRFQIEPEKVSYETGKGSKRNCIDKRDNLPENSGDNVPDNPANPDFDDLLGRLKEKQAAVALEEKEDFQVVTKSLFEKFKTEMIQAAASNGVNYVPSDEAVNQKVAIHLKWRRN